VLLTHKLATLCYIVYQNTTTGKDELLLLYRNKKVNDFHEGKYIPPGGRFELGETPLECAIREIREETGYDLKPGDLDFRGYIFFDDVDRDKKEDLMKPGYNILVFLYHAQVKEKKTINNPEGELYWFPVDALPVDKMWKGDMVFTDEILGKKSVIEGKFLYKDHELVEWDFGY